MKIAWGCEFVFELLAPLGEQAQQLRRVDPEVVRTDLLACERTE